MMEQAATPKSQSDEQRFSRSLDNPFLRSATSLGTQTKPNAEGGFHRFLHLLNSSQEDSHSAGPGCLLGIDLFAFHFPLSLLHCDYFEKASSRPR